MQSVVIAGTDLTVSRWSFGTASLHHLAFASTRRNLLDAASDAGFTHFDTSPYYGYGVAESDLGRFMVGRRAKFTVATKVGLYPPGAPSASGLAVWARKATGKVLKQVAIPKVDWSLRRAERSLDQSLARMRTDYVDLLLLHEPVPSVVPEHEYLEWLEKERMRGRLRHFGLAGKAEPMVHWIRSAHGLAKILQVKDSLERCQANVVRDADRELQFTYGYLAGRSSTVDRDSIGRILHAVLARNQRGSVIVSTKRRERLKDFAEVGGA